VRYRFGDFVLSPARRVLARGGRLVPLIPRYFDLLVLLVEQRDRAVSKQEIFDRVWTDVVVSDSALTQAIRTIRRTLGDDPRDPRFVRTVSRRGYQFVYVPIEVEDDAGPWPMEAEPSPPDAQVPESDHAALQGPDSTAPEPDPFVPLLAILLREGSHRDATDDQRYDAAIALHELGTAEALRRLDERPGHEEARAVLRDARWDAPGAGPVPLLGAPGRWRAASALVARRSRQALALASARWAAAALGAAAAGTVAGLAGGLALRFVSEGETDGRVALTLALVGAAAGALGGAGVGTGLAAAEAVARSARALALTAGGALTGLLTGWLAHHGARAVLTGLFGRDIPGMGGPLEGLVLGAATGLGYAIATRRLPQGGMAAPRGRARVRVAVLTGLATAIGAVALALGGRHLVGSSLDLMADAFAGSQVGLEPLARVLGEERLRPVTRMIVSGFEGLLFGSGIAFGLTTRPRPRTDPWPGPPIRR
jgi:DNA-binding winged helix-turn-helix (wHTH) protein